MERGDAKSPDRAGTLVNAPLWIMREHGTDRAKQLSAVLLSDRAVQAASARVSCGETHENHRRHRGSHKEEAGRRITRRDPGAGPEACRCSSPVPRPPDPRPRLPPRPSLPCPPCTVVNSSWVKEEGLCCHLFLKAAWEPKSGGGWTVSGSNTRGRGGERDNSDRTWCRNSGQRRGPGHFLGRRLGCVCLPRSRGSSCALSSLFPTVLLGSFEGLGWQCIKNIFKYYRGKNVGFESHSPGFKVAALLAL